MKDLDAEWIQKEYEEYQSLIEPVDQVLEIPEFLSGFEGTVNAVSADENAPAGEADTVRAAREACNAARAQRRIQEQQEEEQRWQARDQPVHRNLADEFDLVGERWVYKTSSANIAVAKCRLETLDPRNPGIQDIVDYLTAAEA